MNLVVDLRLIKKAEAIIDETNDLPSQLAREELTAIYQRIYQAISSATLLHSEHELSQLLPDFLHVHPDITANLVIKIVRETLNYVSSVCHYYALVKTQRPLTPDEKQIGKELISYLAEAQKLLNYFEKNE